MKKKLHLIIHGKVQMVLFRSSTQEKAQSLELSGWVKNNSNGTVEAVFEGEEKNLKKILEFCKQGPSAAEVKEVKENWEDCQDEFEGFEIKY